jgi:hypothetical protein
MTAERFERPRDSVSLAKLIGDMPSGQVEDAQSESADVG